jgi:hypothetical protein
MVDLNIKNRIESLMKKTILVRTFIIVLTGFGCIHSPSPISKIEAQKMDEKDKNLETIMSEEFLKKTIVIGKTTESEVKNIYGNPRSVMGGAGAEGDLVKSWIYVTSILKEKVDYNKASVQDLAYLLRTPSKWTVKGITFNFKNGVVSSYTFEN